MGQKLMRTLAGQEGEQRIEGIRREDSLKKAPESLHGFPQEARLWLCPGCHPFLPQRNLWALSLLLLAPPHRCL